MTDAATLSESPESPSGAVDSTFSSTVSVAAGQGEEEDVVLTFNDLNAGKEDMSSASGFTMAWDRAKSGQVSMVRFGARREPRMRRALWWNARPCACCPYRWCSPPMP